MDGHMGNLDPRYSSEGAAPTEWREVDEVLATAEVWWLSTARPDGRLHVTPLIAVWDGGALHFCTGPEEQKAANLAAGPNCALTTGCNRLHDGLDVVVEGEARRVTDDATLHALAAAWEAKYGSDWRFLVRDGAFVHAEESLRSDDPGEAHVFAVAPRTVHAFGKGEPYRQTRWTFPSG